MRKSDIEIGREVIVNRSFVGVESGTKGIIVEDYGTGITIAWDQPDRPLPEGLTPEQIAKLPAVSPECPLRDGFSKEDELHYLEVG